MLCLARVDSFTPNLFQHYHSFPGLVCLSSFCFDYKIHYYYMYVWEMCAYTVYVHTNQFMAINWPLMHCFQMIGLML